MQAFADYEPFLEKLASKNLDSVVVGGAAVNLWTGTTWMDNPYMTKDLDLVALSNDETIFAFADSAIECRGRFAEYPALEDPFGKWGFGQIEGPNHETLPFHCHLKIPGLDYNTIEKNAVGYQLSNDAVVQVLDPPSLLVSAAHNTLLLPQDMGREDGEQLVAIARAFPEFADEAAWAVKQGDLSAEGFIERFTGHLSAIENSIVLGQLSHYQLSTACLFEDISSYDPKIEHFCRTQLEPWLDRTSGPSHEY